MGSTGSNRDRDRIMIRLAPDLKRRCAIDAGVHGRSVNEHLTALLDEHVPGYEELLSVPAAG